MTLDGFSQKVVEKVPLIHIEEVNTELQEVIDKGKRFVGKCYGQGMRKKWRIFETNHVD